MVLYIYIWTINPIDLSLYSFVHCDLRNAFWQLYLRIAAFAFVFYLVSQGIVISNLLIAIEFVKKHRDAC